MININIESSWKIENDSWKSNSEKSKVIQFYLEKDTIPDYIYNSFSYIYVSETDEVEFSFNLEENVDNEISFFIYYTSNELKTEIGLKVAKITVSGLKSTVIFRIPAYGRNIREIFEEVVFPENYNPTLGSNLYKNPGDNSYITRDSYEDYIRSSNIEGHYLDDVGRKQVQFDKGYYKIIKTLTIKCNELERTINSDGNYYSADRSVTNYRVYGIYTYDLYDADKNLLRENVTEVTSHIVLFDTTNKKRVIPDRPPYLGNLQVPEASNNSYKNIYVGQLYYEDFDGILQCIQSRNHITIERFIAVKIEETEGTPVYRENGYPLYIIGPNKNDKITFIAQVEGEKDSNTGTVTYPEGNSVSYSFHSRQYQELFLINPEYNSSTGKLKITIIAREQNNEADPFRPSYAKILPILENTTFNIIKTNGRNNTVTKTLTIPYYVIQKSSKIGIIPKRYSSKDSTTPIDLNRDDDGKYLLEISAGIGVKLAYLGITSEVDPYDKDIVRNWSIREDMRYTDETGSTKIKDREYFFESYTGAFEEKITFISGSYDGRLTEFYIRDYIDRSDVWRRALYESEVTIIPIIDNIDKTVDLGGGWSYSLDTETNYFIGTNLLYLFNDTNRYRTQRFNLEFTCPEHTGPDYSNFRASINNFNIIGGNNGNSVYDEEEGITYTYYDNPMTIYNLLYSGGDTSHTLTDVEKDKTEEIPVREDDNYITGSKVEGKYLCLTKKNTGCPAVDGSGNPKVEKEDGVSILYLKLVNNDTGWEALNSAGLSYNPKKYVQVTIEDTGYPAIDPITGKQRNNSDGKPLFIPVDSSLTKWKAVDNNGEYITGKYVQVTTDDTGYPTISGNPLYLDLIPEDEENKKYRYRYPAFDSAGIRIRNNSNQPMNIPLVTDDTGWDAVDELENQLKNENDSLLYVKVTSENTGYQAYSIVRHRYIDKYQSLIEIKSSSRKRIFFGFEDIIDRKIVKFDIIYPQDYEIDTKDIVRIPTTNPLKFVFKLIATSAVYELQEIRFYCGIEGIQPIKLLSESHILYPEPGKDYVGYPEIELEGKQVADEEGISRNKFNVLSETYSDSFPDWRFISAYNTFSYSAPNGNKLITIRNNEGLSFEESKSYLQIDSRDDKGGSDFIDFIRVREGLNNWWDDWRFFVYNKYTNRFSLYCSTGSSEFRITDDNNRNITEIVFDKVGLYKLNISTTTDGTFKKLTVAQTSKKVENLYIAGFDTYFDSDPNKPQKGTCRRGEKLSADTSYSISVLNPNGTNATSFVLYLWYEGCTSKNEVKSGEARLEFVYTINSDGSDITYTRNVTIIQTPKNSTFKNFGNNLKVVSHYYNSTTATNTTTKSLSNSFPINNQVYGFPIFNGKVGSIDLEYDSSSSYPYRIGLSLSDNNNDNFLMHEENFEIDSPLDSNSNSNLTVEDCYIVGSFIKCTHSFSTSDSGKGFDEVCNQSERSWTLTFTDGRGQSANNLLYYYSPIDITKLKVISSGAKNGRTEISGRTMDTGFLINAGDGQNNYVDSRNENTLYYDYSRKSQSLIYPSISNLNRLVISEENDSSPDNKLPINIKFLTKALHGNNEVSLGSDPTNIDTDNNRLIKLNDFKAIEWSQSDNNNIDLRFFNDGDEGSTNIPLNLLSLFGNNLDDSDKNKGWITTSKIKFNLKVNPPEGMSKELFNSLMTSPTGDDSKYPKESQWYGIGQSFINKIEVTGYEIQPSTANGTDLNPKFIIPLSWFKSNTSNHSIKIRVNYEHITPYSSGIKSSDLIFGAKLYKRDNTKPNKLGEEISCGFSETNNIITITFSQKITTDIIVVPEYTNIEYNYIQNNNSTEISTGWGASLKTFNLKSGGEVWDTNVELKNKTFSKTTDDKTFLGLQITGDRDNNSGKYLNNAAVPTISALRIILNGFFVNVSLWVDSGNTLPSEADADIELHRKGYQYAYLIQPGVFYQYTPEQFTSDDNIYYKIWYEFRPRMNGKEFDGGLVQGQVNAGTYIKRTVYVLFPGRSSTIKLDINRHGAGTPSTADFYREEFKIQVLKLDKGLNPSNPGNDVFPRISWIEDLHLVARKNKRVTRHNDTSNNGNSGTSTAGATLNPTGTYEEWIDVGEGDNNEPRPAVIAGPYPVSGYSDNEPYHKIGSYNIQFRDSNS